MKYFKLQKVWISLIIISLCLFITSIALAAGSISGKVILQSRTNHQNLITFRLANPGESTPLQTYEVNTASDGSYILTDIPAGIYNLSAKASNFLRQNKVLIEVTEGQNASNVDFNLLGGDANGDNSIATGDMLILQAAWLSNPESPNWDERADFNGDGSIGTGDLIILSNNWLKNGFEPQITITSPEDNTFTTSSPITVSGTIDDNNATVVVNGITATVASNIFTATDIPLSQGQNTISAIATDQFNNQNADLIIITYDTTTPTTPIVTDDGAYTTSLTELHATWSSEDPETGIAEYQYSIGTSAGATDVVDWTSAGTDTEVTHTDLTLTQGQEYFFNVIATNGTDIESEEGHSDGIIAIDETTLLIEITSPEEDNALFNSSPITVEGTVSNSSTTVTVNNTSATVTDNTFTASVDITEGTNIITAKATLDTQTAQDQIDVILDISPPSISIFTPDENAITKSNIIYGRVSDDVISINVDGTSAELIEIGEYNKYFLAQPTLTEGLNTITIEAQDLAGNITQKTHTFTYNTTSPKVTITSPANNSTINLSPITITGTVASEISYIFVEASTGIIEDTNFTADYIRLNPTKSVITASGYDELDNKYQDVIIINSPDLKHYELFKVSGDIQEYEEGIPEAGSNWDLTVELYYNDVLAVDEEIEFTITQGNGTLLSQYALTDADGLATVILTTDTDASVTNQVEAKSSSHSEVKVTFYVDTKPAQPGNLIKITDETQTPVPGATIPIIIKLTDAYNNVIEDEQIDFSISQGTGTLSANSAITNYYGEATVNFTAPTTPETLTQITANSATNPSTTTTFNITTSPSLTITINDIIAKVNTNDEKIQDIKADITVTSNTDFLPPTMQLKIWQKGDKQKVEEIYPESKVYIRPILSEVDPSTFMDRTIISYNSANNIYAIKSKANNQTEEYPYEIDYIDYNKGVIIKTEYYLRENNFETVQIKEYSDFTQIGDIWGFQKEVEKIYVGGDLLYATTNIYFNIQINTGIPDSVFE